MTLRKIGSDLQGHPNMNDLPGIDMSTGSLGQGISAAVGMALASKVDKKDYSFNSRTCEGATHHPRLHQTLHPVSIHAPVKVRQAYKYLTNNE